MRRRPALMLAAAAAALVAAGPSAPGRQAEVDHIIFDLCPNVLDGSLPLDDPAKTAAIGFTPTEPRQTPGGPQPRAAKGTGNATIVIAGRSGEGRSCGVWFGGPDNESLLNGVRRKARSSGFKGGNPLRLGDNTKLYAFRRAGQLLTLIAGNAGGEVDIEPATTVILMPES